ncbi:hypothetical protein [Streptomyces axinellae]|uniref:Uncharacterized protein n=1 Tax=Streptomyces axinellae TaxID=552788 RepID=A0ABP6C1X2_9ACTN
MTAPHTPPLVTDDCGNALVSFIREAEDKPSSRAPLPVALVALWHGNRVLMAFDRLLRPGRILSSSVSLTASGPSCQWTDVRRQLREAAGPAGSPVPATATDGYGREGRRAVHPA